MKQKSILNQKGICAKAMPTMIQIWKLLKRKFEQLKVSYEGMANMAGIIASLAKEMDVESFLDFKEDF